MLDENKVSELKNTLEGAQGVMVVLPTNPNVDELITAAALYHSLLSVGKRARLVAPRVPSLLSELKNLSQNLIPESDHIQTELGNENLTISFDYSEDQVDKVSYHIGEETGKFHLTIKPKPGFAPLNIDTVEFGYTGASADLIFLVNVSSLESLEQLYFGYEELYKNAPIVNINLGGTSLGALQVTPTHYSSLSELMTTTLLQLGLTIDDEVATSLLYGIEQFSQNLTAADTEPETFEVVAKLLRAGARRLTMPSTTQETFVNTQETAVKKESLMSFGEALRNASEAKEIPLEMADEQAEQVVAETTRAKNRANAQSSRRRRHYRRPKKQVASAQN